MPSIKKRINLTVSEEVYNRILAYEEKNGLFSDATACLQLIVRQLDSYEQQEEMLKLINNLNREDLRKSLEKGMNMLGVKEQ